VLPALDAAIEDAGLLAPVMVGHSLGAVLATVYAARYPTSGVINVDQPLLTAQFAELLRSHEATLRGPEYLTLWNGLTASMHTELLPADSRQLLRVITDPRQELLLGYWHDLLTMSPAQLHARMEADLAAIRAAGVPYRIIFGQTPNAEHQNWLTGIIPDLTSTVLPDSGHFPHLARPTEFAHILAATGGAPAAD
jgi:pimeloyl-ACP methyl ester carboxylesterase